MRPVPRTIPTTFVALTCLLMGLGLALAQTPADESFWQSIQASTNAAEFRAYLDAFPKGFYAERARRRIADLEGRAPPPPPSVPPAATRQPPPASTDIPFTPDPSPQRPAQGPQPVPVPGGNPKASVLTSYNVIREVQERLYALNYQIKVINGQLSKETREAISAWQQVVRRPVTGDMTGEELAHLRGAAAIMKWGAIAFEAAGAYGYVWERGSRQDAETDAIAECRKQAKQNANNCQVFTLGDSQCGSMSWYRGVVGGRQYWGAFVVRRATFDEAQREGLEECRRQGKAPSTCQTRITFCADGSHRR